MWRKKRVCSRAVISERPQITVSRWKCGIPALWATRLIFAAPSFVTTAEASWLFDHRIIGARICRSSPRRSRERTSGWRR